MEKEVLMTDPRYPIGKFERPRNLTDEQRIELIRQIDETPSKLRAMVSGLSDQQIDTPYRTGGWTVRQVVHHLPDSHLNAYVRIKLALTEQEPTIRPYNETLWAELQEARSAPIEISLLLLESLHRRWVLCLRSLKSSDYSRTLRHPDLGLMMLDDVLALYAWHGRHHVAHIGTLRDRMGW